MQSFWFCTNQFALVIALLMSPHSDTVNKRAVPVRINNSARVYQTTMQSHWKLPRGTSHQWQSSATDYPYSQNREWPCKARRVRSIGQCLCTLPFYTAQGGRHGRNYSGFGCDETVCAADGLGKSFCIGDAGRHGMCLKDVFIMIDQPLDDSDPRADNT